MEKAKRINEFSPDYNLSDPETGTEWLIVLVSRDENIQDVYKKHPKIAEYNGKKFYKMSFNSDNFSICYKEAKDLTYHERYSS